MEYFYTNFVLQNGLKIVQKISMMVQIISQKWSKIIDRMKQSKFLGGVSLFQDITFLEKSIFPGGNVFKKCP